MKKTNIAIISRTDSSAGGAGQVAEELFFLINQTDHYLGHLWRGFSNKNIFKDSHELYHSNTGRFIYRGARYISRVLGLSDFIPFELATHLASTPVDYDLYHFHSISAAFSPISLNWISKRKPSIWTFHDCSPFTGGCMYPCLYNCRAFYTKCDNCPQLDLWPILSHLDFTGYIQSYKRKIFSNNNVTAVVPSKWLSSEAYKSGFFKERPMVIPNCVNTLIFRPINKTIARNFLGLPHNKFIILIIAAFLSDERKGIKYALQAISGSINKPYVLALGNNYKDLLTEDLDIKCVGYIQDKSSLPFYYSAADIFLLPSLAETFGLVAIESMACGTPVVGFRTGGIPEIVENNINGWLVAQKDVEGLKRGIDIAMTDPQRLQYWSENAIQKVSHEYKPEIFIQRHTELYNMVLRDNKATL